MIIINFKNYKFGKESLELAKLIEKYLPDAIVAVSNFDLQKIAKETKLKVFSQHVDVTEGNRATGFILAEGVKASGGIGTLLNHSEHKLPIEIIKKTVSRAHAVGLKVILCAESLEQAEKFEELRPYAIAFEDPELVGSGKSITTFRADDVEKFAKMFAKSEIIPLCGAGINSAGDVKKAYELKCRGVLISSAIVNVPSDKAERLLKEISSRKDGYV